MSREILSNILWRFLERMGAKSISMIVQIVLARLLLPEYYGTVALVTVFTAILDIFIDSGMGDALIQKADADALDFSTVFFFNLGMCSAVYVLLFFAAPLIEAFYHIPGMTPIIRACGLSLLVSGLKNTQQAYVAKHMLFKKFFFSTLGGTVFSAILGIALAYAGAGVWALVALRLSNVFIDTLILWITVEWRPKLQFSWDRFRRLFSFGWRMLASSLIATVYDHLGQLIIGKKYTREDLAYYNQGGNIPSLVGYNLDTAISSVLLPALAREQDQPELMKAHVKRAIQISSYIIWPAMLGIMACANSLVSVLLTDKWLPAVPYLRIACISFSFIILNTVNLQAITAMGRSDLYLKMSILKRAFGIVFLILAVPYGVLAIALAEMGSDLLNTVINIWPNRKLLHYRYFEQMKDVLPSMALSAAMAAIVYPMERLGYAPFPTLCLQIFSGVLIYLAGSAIFRLEGFRYICSQLAGLFGHSEQEQ